MHAHQYIPRTTEYNMRLGLTHTIQVEKTLEMKKNGVGIWQRNKTR